MEEFEHVENEIVLSEQPAQNIVMMTEQEVDMRADLLRAIIPRFVRVCYQNDILDMGGKPYITNSGCQKIAQIARISMGKTISTVEHEDVPDKPEKIDPDTGKVIKKGRKAHRAYMVTVEGSASWMGREIYEFGGATTEDGFYDRPNESPIETRIEVHKKARANWQGRCVRTLLGLQTLSWEMLEDMGYKRGYGGSISYGNKSNGNGGQSNNTDAADETRIKVSTQIFEDVGGNPEAAKYVLKEMTGFQGSKGWVEGKEDARKITDKAIQVTWGKIKPGGKERDRYESVVLTAKERFSDNDSKNSSENDDVPF